MKISAEATQRSQLQSSQSSTDPLHLQYLLYMILRDENCNPEYETTAQVPVTWHHTAQYENCDINSLLDCNMKIVARQKTY